MRILALNAYHGGSHAAFLDGWVAHSRHQFTVLTLPAHHWKWRMRHAAITFGEQISTAIAGNSTCPWGAIFCTDMLNLAELNAFVPPDVADLPRVIYFHENQLTYPDDYAGKWDFHFAFTNFSAALAADGVWFNSAYHRDVFLHAMRDQLQRMPDESLVDRIDDIAEKAIVQPPGIESTTGRQGDARQPGPIRLVWAARWENDKGADVLFDALRMLKAKGVAFQISVLGQSFKSSPSCFEVAKSELNSHLTGWGFATRDDYSETLLNSDVFVSTARHEFFGIAAVEAVAAGCLPVVPNALAYPEVLGKHARFYEHKNASALANELRLIAEQLTVGVQGIDRGALQQSVNGYYWPTRAAAMDEAIELVRSK